MRSPGRPGVNQREAEQAFWVRVAAGASSEDAALASGESQPAPRDRWSCRARAIGAAASTRC